MPFEPNLPDSIDRKRIHLEVDDGIHLVDVLPGTVMVVETQNRVYTIVSQQNGEAWISGHPVFCPEPVLVNIHGSTGRSGLLWELYIGRGMHLEFGYPNCRAIKTSRILDVREKS